jgi:hypothetical protein
MNQMPARPKFRTAVVRKSPFDLGNRPAAGIESTYEQEEMYKQEEMAKRTIRVKKMSPGTLAKKVGGLLTLELRSAPSSGCE